MQRIVANWRLNWITKGSTVQTSKETLRQKHVGYIKGIATGSEGLE